MRQDSQKKDSCGREMRKIILLNLFLALIISGCGTVRQPQLGDSFENFRAECKRASWLDPVLLRAEDDIETYGCLGTHYYFKDRVLIKVDTPDAFNKQEVDIDLKVEQK